jgi:hypothetical protein
MFRRFIFKDAYYIRSTSSSAHKRLEDAAFPMQLTHISAAFPMQLDILLSAVAYFDFSRA